MFALVLLSIGDGGSYRNDAALGCDTRLDPCTLDNIRARMRELGRLKHCAQIGPATGVAKRRERDNDYHSYDRNRNIAMPPGGVEPTSASSATANVTERSIVLKL